MSTRAQTNTFAFMAGITAGSIIAMLYAPKSGEETRNGIKTKMKEARDKAQKASTDTLDKVNSGIDAGKQKMDQGMEMAKSKTGRLKSKTSSDTDTATDSKAKDLPDSFKTM